MDQQHSGDWSRRAVACRIAAPTAAGLVGVTPRRTGAEPPPETTRIRFTDIPAAWLAPQYLAEELLKAEGFTDVQFVRLADYGPGLNKALVSGQIHFVMNDPPNHVMGVDRECRSSSSLVSTPGVTSCSAPSTRSVSTRRGSSRAVPRRSSPAGPTGRSLNQLRKESKG